MKMAYSLTQDEASQVVEGLYENDLSIAVEELDRDITQAFADVDHLPKGFFVVLRSKDGNILDVGPVFKQGNDDNRHGLQRIHVSQEKELSDDVVGGSIRAFLYKFKGAPVSEKGFWEKTGTYSKDKALAAILKG